MLHVTLLQPEGLRRPLVFGKLMHLWPTYFFTLKTSIPSVQLWPTYFFTLKTSIPSWPWNSTVHTVFDIYKCKGKVVPLQAWSGLEGSRKLKFPDFMTTAQDGGKVVSLTHRPPLPPGNTPGTHFC